MKDKISKHSKKDICAMCILAGGYLLSYAITRKYKTRRRNMIVIYSNRICI